MTRQVKVHNHFVTVPQKEKKKLIPSHPYPLAFHACEGQSRLFKPPQRNGAAFQASGKSEISQNENDGKKWSRPAKKAKKIKKEKFLEIARHTSRTDLTRSNRLGPPIAPARLGAGRPKRNATLAFPRKFIFLHLSKYD